MHLRCSTANDTTVHVRHSAGLSAACVLLLWLCFHQPILRRDDTAVRRLTLLWVANNSMSVDLCASIAYSEQWLVFGVEGGSECWAGALEAASEVVAAGFGSAKALCLSVL